MAKIVKFKINGITEALVNQHIIALNPVDYSVLLNDEVLNSDASGNVELELAGSTVGDEVIVFGDNHPSAGSAMKGFNYYGVVESDGSVTQYDNIIFFGASIIAGAFQDDSRIANITDNIKEASGLGDTTFYSKATSGATSYAYVTMVDELVTELTDLIGNTLVVIHGPGNDVSNGRPYSTDDTTYSVSNMRYVFDTLIANEWDIAYAGVSWRNYADVPPEDNGSAPYNEGVFYPLIQEYCPDWWDSVNNVPYINMFGYTKASEGELLTDAIHPHNSAGEFATNQFLVNAVGRKINNSIYNYQGKSIVGCWSTSELDIELSTGIGRFKIGELVGAGSYFKDSAGDLSPLHFVSGGGLSNTAGRADSGVTGYSLLNQECTGGAIYTASEDVMSGYFWLGGDQYAGITGTLQLTGSRETTSIDRWVEFTVDSVTKSLDCALNPPQAVSLPFVVDENGVIKFTWNKQAGSSYGYFSAWQLDFD